DLVGGGARGVVVGQPDNLQARHFSFPLEPAQFADKALGAQHVRVIHVEATKPGIEMILERRDPRDAGVVGGFAVANKFAITAIAPSGVPRPVPEITTGWSGDV